MTMEFLVLPKFQEVLNNNKKKNIMLEMSNGRGRQLKEVAISKYKTIRATNKVGLDYNLMCNKISMSLY